MKKFLCTMAGAAVGFAVVSAFVAFVAWGESPATWTMDARMGVAWAVVIVTGAGAAIAGMIVE